MILSYDLIIGENQSKSGGGSIQFEARIKPCIGCALLLIHCLIFLQLLYGGFVFGPCFAMHYKMSFLGLQSS